MTEEELTASLETLLADIGQPISDGSACGDDVTYDDDFQWIRSEVDKIGAVGGAIDHEKAVSGGGSFSGATGVDFGRISEVGYKLLREKSKDLRVAAYVAMAAYNSRGMRGLAEGLAMLNRLAESYWDDLFPPLKRMRARKSALEMLIRHLTDNLAEYKPTLEDRASLEYAKELLAQLQPLLAEKMAADAPILSRLSQVVEELIRKAPKPAPPKVEAPVVEGSTDDRPAQSGAPSAPSPGGIESRGAAESAVMNAAEFLLQSDPTNPVPYRLHRVLRWGLLEQEPPSEEGKTLLEAPLPQRREYLGGLLKSEKYEEFLAQAEDTFTDPPNHFWLDLQRMMATAMSAHPSYKRAGKAIESEAAAFYARVPGIGKLKFSDGTPFADPMTIDWLQSLRSGSSDSGGPSSEAVSVSDGLDVLYEEARKKLIAGDLPGAMVVMHQGASSDAALKDRFKRRLFLATLCMTGNQPAIAAPVLESLDEEIDRRKLSMWDPHLSLNVWSTQYRCYERLAGEQSAVDKAEIRKKAARVFEKICRLDAKYALDNFGE